MKNPANPGEVRTFDFRAPRFCTSFHFFVEVDAAHTRYDAVCADIGADGLAADLAQNIDPTTQVTLWLLFPGETVPARIQATVEYRREKRHGFNFLYSSPAERASVEAFIQSIQG
jgi:hypothetical protein